MPALLLFVESRSLRVLHIPAGCFLCYRMPSSSAGVSGGRIDGRRLASIDLPAPGGPTIRLLWTIKLSE